MQISPENLYVDIGGNYTIVPLLRRGLLIFVP